MNRFITLALVNWKTTLAGFLFAGFTTLYENPTALDFIIPPDVGKKIYGVIALLHVIFLAMNAKDATTTGNGSVNTPAKVAQSGGGNSSGVVAPVIIGLLIAAFALNLVACSTLQAMQNNPGVQAAETAGISIGGTLATGSPAFAYLAPVAVNGLTALADGSNPTAVTGTALQSDAALITSTVAAAIPNSTGKTVATQIAQAYTSAMAQPGVPQTTTGANAVIGAIAAGLTTGANTKLAWLKRSQTIARGETAMRRDLALGVITPADARFSREQTAREESTFRLAQRVADKSPAAKSGRIIRLPNGALVLILDASPARKAWLRKVTLGAWLRKQNLADPKRIKTLTETDLSDLAAYEVWVSLRSEVDAIEI